MIINKGDVIRSPFAPNDNPITAHSWTRGPLRCSHFWGVGGRSWSTHDCFKTFDYNTGPDRMTVAWSIPQGPHVYSTLYSVHAAPCGVRDSKLHQRYIPNIWSWSPLNMIYMFLIYILCCTSAINLNKSPWSLKYRYFVHISEIIINPEPINGVQWTCRVC